MRGESNWSEDDPREAVHGRQDIMIVTPVGHSFWEVYMAQVSHRAITFLGGKPGEGRRGIYDNDSWPEGWRWVLAPLRD